MHGQQHVHAQELATIPEVGWENALLNCEQTLYVEENLVDLLGAAAMNNEQALQPQHAPLSDDVDVVHTWGDYQPAPHFTATPPTFQCTTASMPPTPIPPARHARPVQTLCNKVLHLHVEEDHVALPPNNA